MAIRKVEKHLQCNQQTFSKKDKKGTCATVLSLHQGWNTVSHQVILQSWHFNWLSQMEWKPHYLQHNKKVLQKIAYSFFEKTLKYLALST